MTETANAKEQTPIIFLDDIRVVFNTRTGSILHPNKVTAVDGLTIKLMPGETIGIVGESGCGKSTTANVMCGLQAPTSGKVYFKGVDVTKRTADMRKTIGRVISVVFQDPATALNARMTVHDQLLDPMIVHNVGTKAEREARIKELIEMVGLPSSVLEALPGQMSGGQRQRLALARALAVRPPILILDDTTSAVDLETEKYIQNELANLPFQCTKIIIAQRISSVKDADQIMVLGNGGIAEMGTHEQLLKKKGYYYEIFKLQNDSMGLDASDLALAQQTAGARKDGDC